MSLRTHLIIVSLIIGFVFVSWQLMRYYESRNRADANAGDRVRSIEIVRASWGLNCVNRAQIDNSENDTMNGVFQESAAKLKSIRENNILVVVSALCNLKRQCSIRNTPDAFGFDPDPECYNKEISLEYRCFSYDRPWLLTIPYRETGVIDCANSNQPGATQAAKAN